MTGTLVQPDPAVMSRMLSELGDRVNQVDDAHAQRFQIVASLIVGTNKIPHGLGRRFVGYTLTPTVADATFAHAIAPGNPHPDREVWITVVGVAQPNAPLEVW
jgi:hypothetical protein